MGGVLECIRGLRELAAASSVSLAIEFADGWGIAIRLVLGGFDFWVLATADTDGFGDGSVCQLGKV